MEITEEKILTKKINELTNKIMEEHPELYKHLMEMPQTIPNMQAFPDIKKEEVSLKNLTQHYESLKTMLEKHEKQMANSK
ncbi:hypothetical protein [Flexithrix dorotheae]|uniref:hypothetical protein n=1 Tax=Flexithrix dorotheae TaxID=70993 RepID=UPI0003700F04|nr:hypothetical protein [Flexithrix dorotheae]